jgi:LysM repeat protein
MSSLTNKVTVKAGESLPIIANELSGDYSDWRSLAYINNLNIFEELSIGQSLTIPSKEEAENLTSDSNEAQSLVSEVQSIVKEIMGTRSRETISKLLGVDQSKLLEDLDLSSLGDSLNKVNSGKSTQDWSLISWVI